MSMLRLDKILTDCGLCSRREAKNMIRDGRVRVDGCLPSGADEKADPTVSDITLDGKPIRYSRFFYFMMNKPDGYLSATEDPRAKTVLELLSPEDRRLGLFPAGRLDKDTEGLLILTNDGEYCHQVISPKKQVYKTYFAKTQGRLTETDSEAFRKGILLADGLQCLPGELTVLSSGEISFCKVRICEGKFHQVKRMLASLGKPVLYLKREAIGGLKLEEDLPLGAYRIMTDDEKNMVFCENNQDKN